MGLAGPVLVQEDEGRLGGYVERRPNGTRFIDGMWELANPECVDEVLNSCQFVAPCDTDELDVFTILLLHLCDRRGFPSAGASPRRPEPKHHVLAL